MFATLGVGIACGVQSFMPAILGTIAFVATAVAMYVSPLSQESNFDGLLRFNINNAPSDRTMLEDKLRRYCKNFALVTLRDIAQGDRLDYAYQVKLRRSFNHGEFVHSLREISSIKGVNLLLQETTVEL